ncbi:CBS domain-containing protein [Fodinibius roseus]|uniref:CBS domain-containing protein n=1 Tax=Fodinibius roseus TaxID=1194090 RepID=A0A1M4VVK9_9BACT|nr:DUF294 nucleotidyltransferase-like domain-containing protein [Fodinibius roseus]SHE72950.1 CBS domain-containing protein [Fodinibius roseus]
MANVIVNRVKEFLKKYPPFSFLSESLLESVASKVELRYYAKEEYLFHAGDSAKKYFFVVKEGAVALTEDQQGKQIPVEYCDEGDVFGVRSLLGRRSYVLDALAREDSLVYAIPVEIFDKVLSENNRVSQYFAAGFASGQIVVKTDLSQAEFTSTRFQEDIEDTGLTIFSGQSDITYSSDVVSCLEHETAEDAAGQMSRANVGSIVVVDKKGFPRGIVTDKDLRNKVVAASQSPGVPVSEIMSSPVLTMTKEDDFATLYLAMIRNRVHHLVLTEDGTDQSSITGIISDHDLLLSQGNSPAVIINTLINSKSIEELRRLRDQADHLLTYYLENEVSMSFVTGIISEINDIIIQKAVELARSRIDPGYPDIRDTECCFLSLGSEGREEQLLRTDLDNALVYEDVADDQKEQADEYFQALAKEVIDLLVSCGFKPCPAKMMASNPRWCQPLSAWKKYFKEWITTPDKKALLHAAIFFDFRPVYGHSTLAEELSRHVHDLIDRHELFLNFFAGNALLNSPPLGFFRNLLVEKSGNQKDKFDIKLRAMMPLVDAARLLILSHGIADLTNTRKRFEKLAEIEPGHAELFTEAARAYDIFMRFRTLEGLRADSSGRYIDPDSLGKIERQLLKNAFYPINEIQKIIRVRFQLDLLGM